jgi:hypothetical protein
MKFRILLCVIFECLFFEAFSKIYINEYMQSNANALFDEEYNLPEGWIELYNDSVAEVSLKGWRIGIKNISTAYTLPDTLVIPARGFVVLYCDESDLGGVHTDFEVPTNNGKIVLFNDSGREEDKVATRKVFSYDYSVGRYPDGSNDMRYFTKATPMAFNENVAKSQKTTPQVVFSRKGGFVEENEIEITLSVSDDEYNEDNRVKIRYTMDGSEPTTQSPIYTSPLRLSSNADSLKVYVVKAKTFADSVISSKSITHSYIFAGRHVDLPIMSITTDPKYLWDNDYGIYVKGNGRGISIFKDSYPYTDDYNFWSNNVRFCNIEYFSEKEMPADINVCSEMHIGGNSTRWSNQKPLMITWKKRLSDKNSLNFSFFKSKPTMSNIKSFMLRNAGNDCGYETEDGESFLRDPFCQTLASQFNNIDYQAYQPTIVLFNGIYMGIFNIRERTNEKYVESNYKIEDADIIENYTDVKTGNTEFLDYSLARLKENSISYDDVKSLFDVEEFTNYLSTNLFVANKDFMSNNVIMWREKKDDGKWRFICKDMDITIGTSKWDSKKFDINLINHFFTSPYMTKDIIKIPEYKNYFISNHIINIGTYFCKNKTLRILDSLANNIEYEIAFHNDKYQLIDDWYSEIEYMRLWLKNRPYYEAKNLSEFFGLGEPVPSVITVTGIETFYMDSLKIKDGKFDGFLFENREALLSVGSDVSWLIHKFKDGRETIESLQGSQLTLKSESLDSLKVYIGESFPTGEISKDIGRDLYVPLSCEKGVWFEDVSDVKTIVVFNSSGTLVGKYENKKNKRFEIELPLKNEVYLISLSDKYGNVYDRKFIY